MRIVPAEESSFKEVKREGGTGARRSYIGTPGSMQEGPQAFLVERPYPNPRIDPHFHDTKVTPDMAPSPAARFPGTKEGWDDAVSWANYKM